MAEVIAGGSIRPDDATQIAATMRGLAASDPLLGEVRDGTTEAALIDVVAVRATETEEAIALIPAMVDYRQAPPAALGIIATRFGVVPRPASASRYEVVVTPESGTQPVPAGAIVQGGGADGRALWRVVAAASVSAPTLVLIEAVEAGPVQLANPTTLQPVTPLPGIASIQWNGTGASVVGQPAETPESVRVRIGEAIAQDGAGRLFGELRSLPYVTQVAIVEAVNSIEIVVVPDVVGADREAEVAAAILRGVGLQAAKTTGARSGVARYPTGQTVTLRWEDGQTDPVNVTYTITVPLGSDADAVRDAANEAVRAVFGRLSVGGTLRVGDLFSAIWAVGALNLTLSAPSANVTPSLLTTLLVPGTITGNVVLA